MSGIQKDKAVFESKRVLVALDMTYMDSVLIRYLAFLKDTIDVDHIIFYHNIWFDTPDNGAELLSKLDRPLEDILKEKIRTQIIEHIDENDFSITITQSEDSAKEIKKTQKSEQIDLTVFGKKVSVNDTGYLIERVLYNNTDSNILVVPETAFYRLEKVLVPLDFSRKSSKALIKSLSLAKKSNVEISCLHVYAISNIYFPYLPIKDLKDNTQKKVSSEWERYKKKYLQDVPIPEITFSFNADLPVSRVIYEHALNAETDMIALPADSSVINSTLISLLKMDMHLPLLVLS